MPARPIIPDRQTMLIPAAAVLVLAAALLLAAGCTQEKSPQPLSVPHTIATPTITLSDRELAEKAIADARGQIEKTDSMISWFRANASMRNDSQFPTIITKREIAAIYVSEAEDLLAVGNFIQARVKAQDGYNKANESYNDALQRQQVSRSILVHCTPKPPFDPWICIILIGGIPILLTALLHSLINTDTRYQNKPILRFPGTVPGLVIIIGMSLVNAAFLTGYKIFSLFPLGGWAVFIKMPWIFIMLYLVVISVIAVGMAVFSRVRSVTNGKSQAAYPETEDVIPGDGNAGQMVKIFIIILLIFGMLAIMYLDFLVLIPNVCY